MLIRFSVENFMSFRDRAEFSMIASKATRHSNHVVNCKDKRVLKGAYVFGANASGKTNFMLAMAFAKIIVTKGLEDVSLEKRHFRIESSYKEKPGVFQFDFFFNDIFYSYGFAISYNNSTIEEEWLYRIENEKEHCIFLRSKLEQNKEYKFYTEIPFKSREQEARFKVYSQDISSLKMSKTLFLTDIVLRSPDNEDVYKPFHDAMTWFKNMIVIFPDSKYSGITELIDNENEKTRLENLLNYFDTGIKTVSKNKIDIDKLLSFLSETGKSKFKAKLIQGIKDDRDGALIQNDDTLYEVKLEDGSLMAYEIVSNHGNMDDLFEYSDESDGTQRLFDLIPIYQKTLGNCVVLVDELDRSLHTKAVQEFINYFYDLSEGVCSQLIATTHDSNVMDLDYVRQDEIWFIERQNDSSSKIYSLNKFRERFDKKVEKEYLLGRYGALPIFNESALTSTDDEDEVNGSDD